MVSRDVERARDLAWAEAFAGLSRVTATLAARLRDIHSDPDLSASDPDSTTDAVSPPERTRIPTGGFGPRQQAVLALGGMDSTDGLPASAVAEALGLKVQNAHTTLSGLEKHGLLERVPDERPIRWRRAQV